MTRSPKRVHVCDADWLREIAIALFQQEVISLGRGSKMAGMHRIEFQKLLASRGICVHYDVEEFEEDIQHLRDRGWLQRTTTPKRRSRTTIKNVETRYIASLHD